jgi:hypothetical protein
MLTYNPRHLRLLLLLRSGILHSGVLERPERLIRSRG